MKTETDYNKDELLSLKHQNIFKVYISSYIMYGHNLNYIRIHTGNGIRIILQSALPLIKDVLNDVMLYMTDNKKGNIETYHKGIIEIFAKTYPDYVFPKEEINEDIKTEGSNGKSTIFITIDKAFIY